MRYAIRDFLEIRVAAPAGFSPDASKVLVASNLPGTMQLYRLPRSGGELVQITDFSEPVFGTYLPTSEEIVLQTDEGGNERWQIYLTDDQGNGLRKVVFEPGFIHRLGGVSRDGRLLAYASNRRNGVDFDVYVRDLASGEERCVFDRGGWCGGAGFSPDGRLLAVVRLTERAGDNELHLVDLASGESFEVAPHDEESQVGMPAWMPDGSSFFFATDIGRELACVARFEMRERSWRPVVERDWDLSCQCDWAGSKLVVWANEEGWARGEVLDPATLRRVGEVPLPGRGVVGGAILSQDGRWMAFGFSSSSEPGDVWLWDTEGGGMRRLTTSPSPLPREVFVEPQLHRFRSFDGESIPVFVYLPREPVRRPPPAVVTVHGGPEAQYVPSFNPLTQYLVHRGYAVVAPNVRGSTGYGKRFQHLDDGRRRLDAVRDLEALHDWLGACGLVDPGRVALMGASYGGYMVLAGLAFQPERWAAGVSIVGISSLVTFLEGTAPWRRRYREREYGSLERDRDFLVQASPITHVERIRAPLFLIHGANDPRVPLGEAEQIHRVLRERGVVCELCVYHDEGHGLAKLANRLDAYPRAADFLDRVLAR